MFWNVLSRSGQRLETIMTPCWVCLLSFLELVGSSWLHATQACHTQKIYELEIPEFTHSFEQNGLAKPCEVRKWKVNRWLMASISTMVQCSYCQYFSKIPFSVHPIGSLHSNWFYLLLKRLCCPRNCLRQKRATVWPFSNWQCCEKWLLVLSLLSITIYKL